MARWGMVIDLDRCTGCQACVTACQAENNVPFVGAKQASMGRSIAWMKIIAEFEESGDNLHARFLPRPCFHCENAPCTKVCPVYATHPAEGGLVAQIYHRCIGCRFCMAACPYTAKYFNWHKYEMPETMTELMNPDVSVRQKGVVEKCTFCHHRLQKAKDRASYEGRTLDPGEYVPACVETCPAQAISFGDLDDSASDVAKLSRSPRAFRPLEELGTEPKVYYLEEGERIEA
jgi:Fe-S-cluster-containing dehydrogenase component